MFAIVGRLTNNNYYSFVDIKAKLMSVGVSAKIMQNFYSSAKFYETGGENDFGILTHFRD
jgi:hypothetical protein